MRIKAPRALAELNRRARRGPNVLDRQTLFKLSIRPPRQADPVIAACVPTI